MPLAAVIDTKKTGLQHAALKSERQIRRAESCATTGASVGRVVSTTCLLVSHTASCAVDASLLKTMIQHSLRAGEKKRSHVPSGVTTGAASSSASFFTCMGFTSTSS